jgi:actin-related protein
MENPPLILDNGSFELRMGLASSDLPKYRTRMMNPESTADSSKESALIVEFGFIGGWDALEMLWRAALPKIPGYVHGAHSVITCVPMAFPQSMLRKLILSLFHVFRPPAVAVYQNAPVIAHFAFPQKKSCLVVHCGYNSTRITPIYEKWPLMHAFQKSDLGANTPFAPDSLFTPSLAGIDITPALPDMMMHALSLCDAEIRDEIAQNIVLTGGITMHPEFLPKFRKEYLTKLTAKGFHFRSEMINIVALPHRDVLEWAALRHFVATEPNLSRYWIIAENWEKHNQYPDFTALPFLTMGYGADGF